MRKGLRVFRHLESTYYRIPNQQTKVMNQIGFKKSQPAKKQTDC